MGSITMDYQRQNLALSVQSQGGFDLTWDDFYIHCFYMLTKLWTGIDLDTNSMLFVRIRSYQFISAYALARPKVWSWLKRITALLSIGSWSRRMPFNASSLLIAAGPWRQVKWAGRMFRYRETFDCYILLLKFWLHMVFKHTYIIWYTCFIFITNSSVLQYILQSV